MSERDDRLPEEPEFELIDKLRKLLFSQTDIPTVCVGNFVVARNIINRCIPDSLNLDGLAIIKSLNSEKYWSASFSVKDSSFPTPCSENIIAAKAKLQQSLGIRGIIRTVVVTVLDLPSGIVYKWQVTYQPPHHVQ